MYVHNPNHPQNKDQQIALLLNALKSLYDQTVLLHPDIDKIEHGFEDCAICLALVSAHNILLTHGIHN